MIYKKVKSQIKSSKQIRLSGGYNCIPFIVMPKLGKVVPGWEQEKYYHFTANSKVGKTKIADFLCVYNAIEFLKSVKNNPKVNIKIKIMYFSLEVSKEEKISQYYSYRLFKDHGITISPEKIKSRFEEYILSDEIERLIDSYDEEMEFFESVVEIIDNIKNPFGIYNEVRNYAYAHGKHYDKSGNIIPNEDLQSSVQKVRDEANLKIYNYVPDDPNEYVFIITDHLSLLHPERGEDLWSTIFKYSSRYCLNMRDRWRYIPVNIQQQASDQEKQQFTFKGDTIVAKLRPSPDGLADCKLTQRDVNVMFGLFAPHRYKIDEYAGYNIDLLQDNYREFTIMLNRSGTGFVNIDLYFNGAANTFIELPTPKELTPARYNNILEINKKAI